MSAPATTPARAGSSTMPRSLSPVQGTTPPRAIGHSTPMDHAPGGAPTPDGAVKLATPTVRPPRQGTTPPATATSSSAPVPDSPSLVDPFLNIAAAMLDDLEECRKAADNRLRILTTPPDQADADGLMRGHGLSTDHRDVARLSAMCDALAAAEHDAVLTLGQAVRRHPMHPWAKAVRGVGDKQFARLLAAIGDPYVNSATGQPRTVSALWAYCGLHVLPATGQTMPGSQGPFARGGAQTAAGGEVGQGGLDPQSASAGRAPRRAKGQQANWSTIAKTRAWLVVEACQKQVDPGCKTETGYAHSPDGCRCSPYKVHVDRRRAYAATTHPEWTGAHSLADGMRIATKELLKDAWREARRLHHESEETA